MASKKLWCSNCGQMNRYRQGTFEVIKRGFLFSPAGARYTREVLPCARCRGEWKQTDSAARGKKHEEAAFAQLEKEGHQRFERLRLGKR